VVTCRALLAGFVAQIQNLSHSFRAKNNELHSLAQAFGWRTFGSFVPQ
jgi:hypothetical protein